MKYVKYHETARRRWLSLKMNRGGDQAARPPALDMLREIESHLDWPESVVAYRVIGTTSSEFGWRSKLLIDRHFNIFLWEIPRKEF